MPRLLRTVGRTAVIAGTASAVSNRVSRRQANRWQQQADAQAYQEQQAAAPQAPPPPPPPPPPAAVPSESDQLAQLKQLGELRASGILTEEEFQAQKAKILGS